MRIVFMGTPFFATKVLDTLIAGGHSVLGVYTQPDKKSGRGRQLINPPVKQYALEKGIPIVQPTKFGSTDEDIKYFKSFNMLFEVLYVLPLKKQALKSSTARTLFEQNK